jgi:hypothetical protein
LLSSSSTFVQIDPLVVMQGSNDEDDSTELGVEEQIFDDVRSKTN